MRGARGYGVHRRAWAPPKRQTGSRTNLNDVRSRGSTVVCYPDSSSHSRESHVMSDGYDLPTWAAQSAYLCLLIAHIYLLYRRRSCCTSLQCYVPGAAACRGELPRVGWTSLTTAGVGESSSRCPTTIKFHVALTSNSLFRSAIHCEPVPQHAEQCTQLLVVRLLLDRSFLTLDDRIAARG